MTANSEAGIMQPLWPAPSGVGAVLTNRWGGLSDAPFDSFNLAQHVGDDPSTVQQNRELLSSTIGGVHVQWLEQVHGTQVVVAAGGGAVFTADAAISREGGVACAVMTADCLPILLCDRGATCVAAVHAGWRGLVGGVVANALAAMALPASELLAYLGPAISQRHFEVGLEVVEAVFAMAQNDDQVAELSKAIRPGQRALHFYIDLYAVARVQLQGLGVHSVYGGDFCTFGQPEFYSYRQQKITGRQASLIWLKP